MSGDQSEIGMLHKKTGYLHLSILAGLSLGVGMLLNACQSGPASALIPSPPTLSAIGANQSGTDAEKLALALTPYPTRPAYGPGELVDYTAQAGDTIPALAARFNTTSGEILAANTFIPADASTMPPGMPMKIPIYYAPFWGSSYQILPDSLFVNGPAQVGFDIRTFVAEQPGWLNGYHAYAADDKRSGAEIIELVALSYSVSPRLLLALLEYQSGALTQPVPPQGMETYPLGHQDGRYKGLYMQLIWAANFLNNQYYAWRIGDLTIFEHPDGRLERPDPWQNAASVALQVYFAQNYEGESYQRAIAYDGLAQTYRDLFGDPWQAETHLPGSLTQPDFRLPFEPGVAWALTGGPHTAWGEGEPLAALDFAPGSLTGGCTPTGEWATAVAPGVVARSEPGTVVLDLDGDGDERTGWAVFYFHLGTEGRAPLGTRLQTGDPVGHPSCEGGRATGTHVHIARKYNGEWIPAGGSLAFDLEGWVAQAGSLPYQGTLTRHTRTVTACDCSDAPSHIEAGVP
jgi:hypothetical protein